MMRSQQLHCFLVLMMVVVLLNPLHAFTIVRSIRDLDCLSTYTLRRPSSSQSLPMSLPMDTNDPNSAEKFMTAHDDATHRRHHHRIHRRDVLSSFTAGFLATGGILDIARPELVRADDDYSTSSSSEGQVSQQQLAVEMKEFVDPVGYFSIRVPKNFFTIRRSIKGDLPDPSTGEGRRGSSIFTAGDMNKAELVAIERFPTRLLLEENGIDSSGDLSTFTSLGDPTAIAGLLNQRRDRDRTGSKGGMSNTQLLPGSIYLTSDGLDLSFQLKTEIEVQKPELLLEQYGVSELYRITTAKASLRSNDGNLMVVYASALETDFNGPDGLALQESVNSFRVNSRKSAS